MPSDLSSEELLKIKITNLYDDCRKDIKMGQKSFVEWCLKMLKSEKFFDEDDFFECLIRSNFDIGGIDELVKVVDESNKKIALENISPTCFGLYRNKISTLAEIVQVIVEEFPYSKIYGELRRSHLVRNNDGASPLLVWFAREMDRSREIESAENNANNNAESETENPESGDE